MLSVLEVADLHAGPDVLCGRTAGLAMFTVVGLPPRLVPRFARIQSALPLPVPPDVVLADEAASEWSRRI